MTEFVEAIKERLSTLERDLNQHGWDQPSAIFVVEATSESDPYLVKIVDFHHHPCEVLDNMPTLNKPRARGLVIAYEAWTVETPEDLIRHARERLDEFDIPDDIKEQALREAAQRAQETMRPSQHPDRVECRFVHCLMKDGTTFILVRKRGQEPEFMPEAHLEGRVHDSMRRVICTEGAAT